MDDFEYDPRFFDVPTVKDTGNGQPPMVDMGADEFYVHIWAVGAFSPGTLLTLRIAGVPGDWPVAFFIGSDTWNPPLVWWPYGLWYIKGPMIGPFMMGTIPANGIVTLSGTIPNSPPGPFTAYIHGLVGMISTNLCVINIK